MFPSPRLIDYGNIIIRQPWYTGTDILAIDSKNVRSTSFVEYTGKTMLASAAAPASYSDLPYGIDGTGFYLNDQWLRTTAGAVPNNTLSTAWTIDYWVKNEKSHPTGNSFFHYIVLHSTSTTNYTSRILLTPGSSDNSNKVTLWNNNQTPSAYQSTQNNIPFRNTTWTHIAFVYNGTNTTNIYVNGVYYDYITRAIASPGGSTYFGPWGNNSTTGDKVVMERYRVRTGQIWTSDFSLNSIYP